MRHMLLAVLFLVACDDGSGVCDPGEAKQCNCSDNDPQTNGARICNESGLTWGECLGCPPPCDQSCPCDNGCCKNGCGATCGYCGGYCNADAVCTYVVNM